MFRAARAKRTCLFCRVAIEEERNSAEGGVKTLNVRNKGLANVLFAAFKAIVCTPELL